MGSKFIFNMRGAAVVCHYMPRTAPVTILVTQNSSNELIDLLMTILTAERQSVRASHLCTVVMYKQ